MKYNPLTLNDINIGDFVQEWLDIPEKWGTPMYIDGIFPDGDVYLNLDGNEGDPFESNVKSIYDIPIDFGILPHFGFFETDNHLFQIEVGEWLLTVHVFRICNTFLANGMLSNKNGKVVLLGAIDSIRMLQHLFYENTEQPLKLIFE